MRKPKLVKTKMDGLLDELVKKSGHKILTIWAADCADRVLYHLKKTILKTCDLEMQLKLLEHGFEEI